MVGLGGGAGASAEYYAATCSAAVTGVVRGAQPAGPLLPAATRRLQLGRCSQRGGLKCRSGVREVCLLGLNEIGYAATL